MDAFDAVRVGPPEERALARHVVVSLLQNRGLVNVDSTLR